MPNITLVVRVESARDDVELTIPTDADELRDIADRCASRGDALAEWFRDAALAAGAEVNS